MSMLSASPFYHQLLRKYHKAFGSCFSNLTLARQDASGEESQRFVIPIEYSARESWLTRQRADPTAASISAEVQPRLAYEMTALRLDLPRKLNSLNSRSCAPYMQSLTTAHRYFAGTPYILTFSLYAVTRSVEDANQIIEQIIPYFAPDYTMLVNVLPSLGITDRMRIVMDGNPQWMDSYLENGFPKTREIIQTFTFNVAAMFYGPVPTTPPSIIRKVIVDLYDAPSEASLVGPLYILQNDATRFLLDDGASHLLNESAISDLRDLARLVRMEINPVPLNAAPIKPVETETTITDFVDGRVANPATGEDQDL